MKKFLIPALALAAVSVAAPAAAQVRAQVYVGTTAGHGYDNRGYDNRGYDNRDWQPIERRLARIDRRIDQGQRNGALTRREAANLRAEFQGLIRLERQYSRGGLSYRERQDLEHRFSRLEQRVRWERRDGDRNRGGW